MIDGNSGRRSRKRRRNETAQWMEPLEPRQLLSGVVHAGVVVSPSSVPASDIQGYTPAQIRKAYGFDQFSFNGSSVAADGSGQTICIVDPFNDPNVKSDLDVFDAQFDLPAPPSLTVVNHTGGSVLPRTDGSWAGEISTDVEWAHAIAPGAAILVVEAQTDNTDDLMAAVDYARHVKDVSVISISWGGGEFSGQLPYDSEFVTPAGHTGVTVVAAAGDNGAIQGAQWPASSPNVVSVGGSVLTIADNSGTYGSETSWTDTSGGYSKFEGEPFWQAVVQRTGSRSVPDVSLNADTIIGQALYDTVPFQGISGWQTTNGTSVATPEWAALVAIADQGRVLAGQGTLDGTGQVLPLLYSLYGAPGTSAYSAYASNFNDITVAQNPNATRGLPSAGYDATTGLGTPKGVAILNALINCPPASQLTDPTQPLASQLMVSIAKAPKTSVIGGTAGSLLVKLSNISKQRFTGGITITVSSETSISDSANATTLNTIPVPALVVGAHGSRTVKVPFTFPVVGSAGAYFLSASVTTTGVNTAPADAVTAAAVTIAPPFVELVPTFAGNRLVHVKPGAAGSASVVVQNAGNILASGTISINLYESTDQTLDGSDTLMQTTPARPLKVKPGGLLNVRVPFVAPHDLTAGSYYLIATITSSVSGTLRTAVIGTR